MSRHWLITGGTGLLAAYLVEACRADGLVTTTARTGGDRLCDLSDPKATRALIEAAAPDVVVHAAAMTDIDRCEIDPEAALAANCSTTTNVAAYLAPSAQLVVISTDQVYPDTPGPHREIEANPVNVYGRSKLEGERAAVAAGNALVLRTNFFGPSRLQGRESLSDFFIRKLSEREDVTLFTDISFSPLHMSTLASLVVELVDLKASGVLNAGCRAGDSKANFGLAVAKHAGLQTETARTEVSAAVPGRARRPHDMRLDISRLEDLLGRSMPTLAQEIEKL